MKNDTKSDSTNAKARLLSTAMSLFAAHGVANVSLREITAQTGLNVAAVNYHFGSKLGLEEAVFEDIAIRVNTLRQKALQSVLDAAKETGSNPEVTDILETFIEPYLSVDSSNQGSLLAQLILKHRLAPSSLTIRLMKEYFDPMAKKYVKALGVANPGIDAKEFVWRYMFMTSVVVLTATDRHENNRVSSISGGRLDAKNPVNLKAALLRFLVGGMEAASKI